MTVSEGPYRERRDVVEAPAPAVREVVVSAGPRRAIGQVETAYTARWAPDAIITGVIGLVWLVIGLIAITRGGFDGPMSDPVVQVVGFTHTATLGLIEIGLGLLLLISAALRSRAGELFFGAILGIGGFVGAVQTSSFKHSLALESSLAWLAVLAGAIIVLSALLMPRFARNSTIIEQI